MPPQWEQFLDWGLKALLGAICVQGVNILSQMKKSIDDLNSKVAIIIEKTDWHSKELDKLENRVTKLEHLKFDQQQQRR